MYSGNKTAHESICVFFKLLSYVKARRLLILRQEGIMLKASMGYILNFGLALATETDKNNKRGVFQTVQ